MVSPMLLDWQTAPELTGAVFQTDLLPFTHRVELEEKEEEEEEERERELSLGFLGMEFRGTDIWSNSKGRNLKEFDLELIVRN